VWRREDGILAGYFSREGHELNGKVAEQEREMRGGWMILGIGAVE
jgi:hypothetical protein